MNNHLPTNSPTKMEHEGSLPSSSTPNDYEMVSIPFNGTDPLAGLFNPLSHCSGASSGPNAPPPSSCGTTSDHSENACLSPGPIKRFRQIYGGSQVGTSNSATAKTISKRPAMNWTENWMNTHYNFSKPGTSTTPSIISNVSEVSQLSVDTQLSVAVDFLNINPNIEPIPHPASIGSSFIENVDPCHFQQMRQCLAQVIIKLNSMNEAQEFDAVCQLYKIGKDHQFIYCSEPNQICQVVQRLVEILLRPNTKPRIKTLTLNVLNKLAMAGNVGLSAIRSLESADRGYFLNAIILCLRFTGQNRHEPDSSAEDDARFATNILSILFTNTVMGEFFRRQARTQAVIRELMLALDQESYGFRHKFLRHIYHLLKPSRELKRFFHQSNGMEICLKLFEQSIDEPMLNGCAELIFLLIDGLGPLAADNFVDLGGIQILATQMNHGSPRLLECIARCLASSSDSHRIAEQSIDDAILACIQLLASTEGDMVKHVVGFIANVQTKHPGAKEFLQKNNAIPNLMFLLSVWADSVPSLPTGHKCEEMNNTDQTTAVGVSYKHFIAQKASIDDLIDTVLLALNNLSNRHADAVLTCKSIIEYAGSSLLFLRLLASLDRSAIIHIRTLNLVRCILVHLKHTVLDSFIFAFTNDGGHKGYPHVLLELFFSTIQKLGANGQNNDKDARTIALKCLLLLNEFMKYPHLLGSTSLLLSYTQWNPFITLRSLQDEALENHYMEFLYYLSASPELLSQWVLYEEMFRFYANIPKLANYAVKIFTRMQKFQNNINITNKN